MYPNELTEDAAVEAAKLLDGPNLQREPSQKTHCKSLVMLCGASWQQERAFP